ncbi:accessory gland-specific peptide 57Db [Drosophila elegans]|nr:accessory gland-specific peptide 57Db [Drosophila elegans]
MKFLGGFVLLLATLALAQAQEGKVNENKNVIHINSGAPVSR